MKQSELISFLKEIRKEIKDLKRKELSESNFSICKNLDGQISAMSRCINIVENNDIESDWIPTEPRRLTKEEKEEYEKIYGEEYEFTFDGRLPDGEGRVLVSTPYGVSTDEFYEGHFEEFCEFGEVVAWMPFPAPYKEVANDT